MKTNNIIQVPVDLTCNPKGSRLMNIASCITSRYDAGICRHSLERTGVVVIIKHETKY